MSRMSEGKGDIRDDGVGSGLSIWMCDGVISLNRETGGETLGGQSWVLLWDTVSLRCLYHTKWRCQAKGWRYIDPVLRSKVWGEDINLEATTWKNWVPP